METGFKDPIAPRNKKKTMKSPWDFTAPVYDDRTKICAGDDYGVGFNAKVGTIGNAKSESVVPMGRVDTMKVDYE